MDEEKAVKTLTAVLREHFGNHVVQYYTSKDRILKDAFYAVQFSEPFIMGYDQFYMKEPDPEWNKYRFGFANTQRTKKQYANIYSSIQDAVDNEEKCKGANYFFAGELIQEKDRGAHFFVTPYSIIGKKEAQNLRKLFYKNVPQDIMSAMHTLSLTNYTDLFKIYSSNSMKGAFLEGYQAYLKLEDMLKKIEFEQYNSKIEQSKIEALLGMSVEEFNKKLNKNVHPIMLYEPSYNGEERYRRKDEIEHTKNETKAYSQFGRWINFLPEFFELAFSMPIEDQNRDTNLEILKLFADKINYIGILAKEYFSGKNFKDYFSCLNVQNREKIVDSLKVLQERNSENDAFLWSQGFKSIGMDYLKVYKEDADTFIDYFRNRSPEEKKVIMKDIMECDNINNKVIEWLNENEEDLMREVGFNG